MDAQRLAASALAGLVCGLVFGSLGVWWLILHRWRSGVFSFFPAANEPAVDIEVQGTSTPKIVRTALHPIVVALVGAWISLQLAAHLLARFSDAPPPAPSLSSVQMVCGLNAVVTVVFLALLHATGEGGLPAYGVRHDRPVRQILDGAAGFLAALLPVIAVLLASMWFREPDEKHSFLKLLDKDRALDVAVWIGLAVVVSAPLAEELIYRVVFQGWLHERLDEPHAIVLASAVFAGVHGWPDMLPLFPLALVLGWVYRRTHSYWAVVLLHALFNLANLAVALLARAAGAE